MRFRPKADINDQRRNGGEMGVACPCCACLTMPGDGSFPGSFVICPVCFWEDDDVQLGAPGFADGANRVSLVQARLNYRSFGAIDAQALPHVRAPRPDELPAGRS